MRRAEQGGRGAAGRMGAAGRAMWGAVISGQGKCGASLVLNILSLYNVLFFVLSLQ